MICGREDRINRFVDNVVRMQLLLLLLSRWKGGIVGLQMKRRSFSRTIMEAITRMETPITVAAATTTILLQQSCPKQLYWNIIAPLVMEEEDEEGE